MTSKKSMLKRLKALVPPTPEPPIGPPALPPSVKGSPTSRQAAEDMSPKQVSRDERRVFAAVSAAGDAGLTDDELEAATGIIHQTVSARRNGLVLKRKIRNSGQVRLTRSRRQAIVWVVGEGIPVKGAPNRRTPKRPDSSELRSAAACLTGHSDAMDRVRVWLLALADQ